MMPTEELEYRLLYSMVVAGKSADFARNAMERFCGNPLPGHTPFSIIRAYLKDGTLEVCLRHARTGNYGKLSRGFKEVATATLDLRKATPAHLETFHGIGPKTARFFILWTRPRARCAALDTHVLKWLEFISQSLYPRSTPQSKLYARIEQTFLEEADRRKMTPRKLDALIWDHCSKTRLPWADVRNPSLWPAILHPIRT